MGLTVGRKHFSDWDNLLNKPQLKALLWNSKIEQKEFDAAVSQKPNAICMLASNFCSHLPSYISILS